MIERDDRVRSDGERKEDAKRERLVFASPFGSMAIEAEENCIISIDLSADAQKGGGSFYADLARKQLEEYFLKRRKAFDFAIRLEGTDFTLSVYRAILKIPYGETRTYGEVARAIGRPKAARAVGGALARNRHLIVVPCHRVVPASGAVGHYRGGSAMKATLLRLEGAIP